MAASSSRSILSTLNKVPFNLATSSKPLHRAVVHSGISSTIVLSSSSRKAIAHRSEKRSFFSLPDISKLAGLASSTLNGGVDTDGDLQKFHARKILPYSQAQLYNLIADVPSYSTFIPFCQTSRVLLPTSTSASSPSSRSPQEGSNSSRRTHSSWKPDDRPFEVDAELLVGFGGLEERYISRVVGRPFESVTATASEQIPMFKSLITTWSFSPASSQSPHPTTNSLTSPSPSSPTTPAPRHRPTREPNSTAPADPEQGPTLLTIDLAFAFINPLHRIASQAVLPKVADKMVEAFEKRCLEVYGRGSA